jgi:hypothetical protein
MFCADNTIGESKNPSVTAADICAAFIQYRFMAHRFAVMRRTPPGRRSQLSGRVAVAYDGRHFHLLTE